MKPIKQDDNILILINFFSKDKCLYKEGFNLFFFCFVLFFFFGGGGGGSPY